MRSRNRAKEKQPELRIFAPLSVAGGGGGGSDRWFNGVAVYYRRLIRRDFEAQGDFSDLHILILLWHTWLAAVAGLLLGSLVLASGYGGLPASTYIHKNTCTCKHTGLGGMYKFRLQDPVSLRDTANLTFTGPGLQPGHKGNITGYTKGMYHATDEMYDVLFVGESSVRYICFSDLKRQ